jgi:hypothetical protein
LLSCRLSLATPPNPRIALRHAPPYADIHASVMTLYVDIYAAPTAPCVDVYARERLGMGSTAIGREASRLATYGAAERAPIASTPVPCRSPALQSSPVRRGDGRAGPDREHVRREPLSGITVLVRRRADGASMTEHVRRGPLSGIAVPPNEENGLTLSKRGLTPFSGGDDWELRG